jgi:hypothetical protein
MAGINMLQLPAYQAGPGIDFSPINNAIDSNRQNALAQRQMGLAEQRNALMVKQDERAGQTHGLQIGKMKRDAEMQEARQVAGRVQYIQGLPPEQQGQAWQQTLQMPGFRDLPPDMHDFGRAAPMLLSKASEYMSPEDKAKLGLVQAQTGMTGAHTELYRAQAADERRKASMPITGFKDAKQLSDVEEGFRKEFSGHAKPYFETRDAYTRIQQAATNPTPAGDMALIYNIMKMYDPGSVVREGEFATAQNATGVPDRILNVYNNIVRGTRLNAEQRADFLGQAQKIYTSSSAQYEAVQRQYRDIARRKGIDERNVFIDYGIPKDGGRMEPGVGPKADRQAQSMPDRQGGGQGAQGMIPPGAVQMLRSQANNPAIIQQFEAKYGPGSARQFLGGQ